MSFDFRSRLAGATSWHARQGLLLLLGLAVAVPLLVGQGCPGVPGVGIGPAVAVKSPSLDVTVTAGELVTIVYDVVGPASSVTAFYDADGIANSGDEVQFAANLASGTNKFTQLSTASLPGGVYRVGIIASSESGSSTAYAPGRVTVLGAPAVAFTSPASELRVGAGVQVPVRFNAGPGVTDFSYRTFYDTDGVFNGNEITIETGSSLGSPVVEGLFDTTGLSPGTYFVGVRITPSAGSPITSYAGGRVVIVSGAFVQVLSPTIGLVASPGTQIQVVVAASDPGNTASQIRLFYDPDTAFGNSNETTIATIPLTGSGTVWDTISVPPGAYFVGAELQNGFLPPPVSYSAGPVTLLGSALGTGTGSETFRITTPLVPATVIQGTPFRVNWVTNLQPGEGTVTIFREPDRDGDGVPDGIHTRETVGFPGIDAAVQFLDFDTTGVVGTYFIGGIITPNQGTIETAYAPAPLTIRPLTFWAGEVGTRRTPAGAVIPQTGFFQGAVFRGYNFGDNLGSAMMSVGDYDGDGRRDIVIAAQFGKPFILAQGGRGAGEAYLIYGRGQRYSGEFDVNTVGSAGLPGVIFSGIVPNPFPSTELNERARAGNLRPLTVDGQDVAPYATEGLRSMALLPDVDGDGVPELVFAFPWCNSYSLAFQVSDQTHPAPLPGLGRLENNGHFLRGGLVIVSSANPLLTDRTALSRTGDRVMQLQEVGQVFDPMSRLRMSTNRVQGPVRGEDLCDGDAPGEDDVADHVFFPCEGFTQFTLRTPGARGRTMEIDPPRLATLQPAFGLKIDTSCFPPLSPLGPYRINLAQPDPPPGPDLNFHGTLPPGELCDPGIPAPFGFMYTIGTGMYGVWDDEAQFPVPVEQIMAPKPPGANAEPTGQTSITCRNRTIATSLPPFGARLLGQTTTVPETLLTPATTANRFGHSLAVSGNFLMIGAPLRTVTNRDIINLPASPDRTESGVIYMMRAANMWNSGTNPNVPTPHNHIIRDLGYIRCEQTYAPPDATDSVLPLLPHVLPPESSPQWEVHNPFLIVGAAPADRLGDVTGLHDINNDGVEDFAIGAPSTHGGRGAVYVIYRRQPQVEGHYLLENLQRDPLDINRLNGLMILGEPGENLGTSIGGAGDLNDDFNDDGFPDLLIGSPNSTPAAGFQAGQVFILFGGRNLLSPAGGISIAELRANGDGMLLTGAHAGDATGMTVANAGDVNGDGIPDILIAAPNASPRFDSTGDGFADTIGIDLNGDGLPDDLNGDGSPDDLTNAGVVYVVFGGSHLTGTISLDQIGTPNLPGFMIAGRKANHHLGGGVTQGGLLARGVASAGDLDGDGRADILIGSILADPDGKTQAGEVYLIYGFRP